MVDMEKWQEMSREILEKGTDPGVLTALMAQATESFGINHAELSAANDEIEKLKKEKENLQKHNMDLYLQVSQQQMEKYGGKKKEEEKKDKDKERAESITINDLFAIKED